MAERNENDNTSSQKEINADDSAGQIKEVANILENLVGNHQNNEQVVDEVSSSPFESMLKKEDNPFSFKKFLNQDITNHKHQNLSRKNYLTENFSSSNEISPESQNVNSGSICGSSKVINSTEMASVLPDFVQDHLVVEQCYLNGTSSVINIDNLNLQHLPSLNLEHRNVDFPLKNGNQRNNSNHHSPSVGSNNLPDFTLSVGQYAESDVENFSDTKGLPDFTVNTRTLNGNVHFFPFNERDHSSRTVLNCGIPESNSSFRDRIRISSSPSVPLDLPLYDGAESVPIPAESIEQPIPFDLTVAAADSNGSSRGIPPAETVSKSLPDFLSDGPIQNDRLGENLQFGNLVKNNNSCHGTSSPESASDTFDHDRFQRELECMRRQLAEKNRTIHSLKSEIEALQNKGRRDTDGLEFSLMQTERNLKQTMKRASNAETALMKSRQENNRLKAELSSLRSEVSNLRLGNPGTSDSSFNRNKSQKIAKELRSAANAAEYSLRSLLTGIDNLRIIAASVESTQNSNDKTEEIDNYTYEDSASGHAL